MTHRPAGGSRRSAVLGIVFLLATYWLLAVSTSSELGVTADEPVHLAGGYSYWRLGDYRLQPENGTLAMRVMALPLLAMDLRWVPLDDPNWQHAFVNRVGYEFLFKLGNPTDRILFAARAMIALFGVFTVWMIWRWATGLFGPTAGWVAAILATLSPTLLAHGGLATSDMAITACFIAVVTAFWRVLHVVTWPRLALALAATGAVLLAKMSGVLAGPMLAVLLVLRWFRPAPLVVKLGRTGIWLRRRSRIVLATAGLALAVGAGGLALVWAGYSFRYAAFAPKYATGAHFFFDWPVMLEQQPVPDPWLNGVRSALALHPRAVSPTIVTRTIGWARDHRLLPEAYLWGFAHTYKFSRVRPAFLNGEFRRTGWPQFFPWTFWLKTTLPTLGLLLMGILALWWVARGAVGRSPGRRWIYRSAPLLILFAVYWAVALRTHLNIGHRHILPTYPVVFVFAGAAALWLRFGPTRLIAVLLAFMVAAHAADSFLVRPFYLSYFQPIAGGPENGWRHLVDSSYDWGQGLPDLSRWLRAKASAGDRSRVYLTYFGADSPRDRALPVIRFADEINDIGPRSFPVRPQGGWFAISATHFQRVYLGVEGPWNDHDEALYQQLRAKLANPAAAAGTPQPELLRDTMDFEVLEFGRLCHFLRHRTPAAVIGGSILLFRLTDHEVAWALGAPKAEIDHFNDGTPVIR